MNVFKKTIFASANWRTYLKGRRYYYGGLYEPSYLEGMQSKVPLYDTINIQISGYDYPVLESYQKLVHRTLSNMDISVEDGWAIPAQHMKILTFKPNSEVTNSQYLLKIYQRIVQVTDVTSVQMPLIIRVLEASLPAGLTINIRPHEESDEETRYIPDTELNTLKQELEDMGGPTKKK